MDSGAILTYLRRQERKPPTGWARVTALFRTDPAFAENNELPQDFAERRLNRRVFSYWQSKRAQGAFPSPQEIRAEELGADWEFCFILDISAEYGFAKFDFLGAELAKFSGVFLSGRHDWTRTVLDKATGQVSKVVTTAGPVLCDDELKLFDGRRLLFRSVLLPLSGDGRTLSHVLGAANGKLSSA